MITVHKYQHHAKKLNLKSMTSSGKQTIYFME